ncbi:MAG: hypothetical protein R3F29_09310 [Planctomycetota bacterium]
MRREASAFLDGRMSARQRGAAQRHLRECAACMRELQQLARLSRAMHNLPPHRVADGMAQRLRKQHDGTRATPAERAATQWARPRAVAVSRRMALAAVLTAALPLVFWLGYRSGRAAAPAAPTTSAPGPGDAQPMIAERTPAGPAAPPPPSALQPRVRATTHQPELVEAPAVPTQPLAAPAPAAHAPPPDARLAGDRGEPAPGAPLPPPDALDDVHRMMEQMMRDLIELTRRR